MRFLFLAMLVVAPSFATIVFDNGGYEGKEGKWRNCFATEIANFLAREKSDKINFQEYVPIGSDYDDSWSGNSEYTVDLQNKSGHVIRARFQGDYSSSLAAINPRTQTTQKGYQCTVNTNHYDDVTVVRVFDRDINPPTVYLKISGSGGAKPQHKESISGGRQ